MRLYSQMVVLLLASFFVCTSWAYQHEAPSSVLGAPSSTDASLPVMLELRQDQRLAAAADGDGQTGDVVPEMPSFTPCDNDCSGNGFCRDAVCLCKPGFSGKDCSTRACPENCGEHGICEKGECICMGDYVGPDCSYVGCPLNCHGQGFCHIGKDVAVCMCTNGYTGEACEISPEQDVDGCPNDCSGVGVCQEGVCYCQLPYTGHDCSQLMCKDNCHGRGTCDVATGICRCASGFYGDYCQYVYCPTAGSPEGECSGHGTCDATQGVCECDEHFYGADCAPGNCKEDCNGHGQCSRKSGMPACVCEEGYGGEACADLICSPLYTGPDCSVRQCPYNCSGHGTCSEENWTCQCENGWEGDHCQNVGCLDNCHGHGLCRDGVCECFGAWSGVSCNEKTVECPNDCSGHGLCSQGACFCAPGFKGEDCSERITADDQKSTAQGTQDVAAHTNTHASASQCQPACSEHGSCTARTIEGATVHECLCAEGWAGAACSLQANAATNANTTNTTAA